MGAFGVLGVLAGWGGGDHPPSFDLQDALLAPSFEKIKVVLFWSIFIVLVGALGESTTLPGRVGKGGGREQKGTIKCREGCKQRAQHLVNQAFSSTRSCSRTSLEVCEKSLRKLEWCASLSYESTRSLCYVLTRVIVQLLTSPPFPYSPFPFLPPY